VKEDIVKVPVRGRDVYWDKAKVKMLTNASTRVGVCMADWGVWWYCSRTGDGIKTVLGVCLVL
jgi:hypothetical protein